MNRRHFLKHTSVAALGLAGSALLRPRPAPAAPAGRKVNVVLILIDDLGWADLPCYGSTFHEAPNLDRLARQGMRFTDAYAACPVCSPTRASIHTGKYPATLNLTDFIPGHWRPFAKLIVPKFNYHLPHEEDTIAEALKRAGYATAHFGKWHTGWGAQHAPGKHGFDEWGGARNKNDKAVDGLTTRAEQFIDKHKDEPFFLYLSHHTVHIPLQARKELVDKYARKAKKTKPQSHPAYAAMIEAMDESVGRIVARLDRHKLADRTLLIFFSDNGGLIKRFDQRGPVVTSNLPLRDEKGSLYEGGIRVPLIVRWPGVAKPGTVCSVPASSIDFYPTILDATGFSPYEVVSGNDGISLVPFLKGTPPTPRDAIFWHYPHYHHTAPCGAVRAGHLKLIEYFEDGRLELYNLKDDIGERNDLAKAMPAKAAALRKTLDDWRKAVGAKMPTPNPNFDPKRAHEWGRRPRPKKN